MEILSIMNGAADPEIREKIKRFALLKGFLTWTPETGPGKAGVPHKTVLAITDMEGAEVYKRDMERLYKKECPGAILFSREKTIRYPEKNRELAAICISCSLSFQTFQKILFGNIQEDVMKNRRYCFGKLQMEKKQHLLIEEGRELKIGPYEFDVLFFLLEHMGRAVSREEINKILPQRKREGGRNVDTHIKNLRRRLDLNDVILSVRSVGYRIDEERFYQKMTEKQE